MVNSLSWERDGELKIWIGNGGLVGYVSTTSFSRRKGGDCGVVSVVDCVAVDVVVDVGVDDGNGDGVEKRVRILFSTPC